MYGLHAFIVVPETRRTCRFERRGCLDNSQPRPDFQFPLGELAAVLSAALSSQEREYRMHVAPTPVRPGPNEGLVILQQLELFRNALYPTHCSLVHY